MRLFSELTPGFSIEAFPFKLSGTVYGTLLNHHTALSALGEAATKAPYNALPKAPVLYIKPRNTLVVSGEEVPFPDDETELEVGACLGLVIARAACRVNAANTSDYIAGYLAVNDISVPHPNYYRPSIRYKARDGFCPVGPMTKLTDVANPNDLNVRTFIDDALVLEANTADSLRSVAILLQDVTEFITLAPGDILAMGAAAPAPRARRGKTVRVEIDGLKPLANRLGA
jgi:5-oxopent-3-ene-1,2,5-tricarboxylate decarboxylase / 2-hydroxyhepta-2,4-diene-1,7-dioate isomerase